MAACLITVAGTSGTLRLDYKIGVDSYSIDTSVGSFYIEDTATDVTYTTLTGDVTASSLCLTVTELPVTCYKLSWKGLDTYNYRTAELEIGALSFILPEISFPQTGTSLADAINNLNTSVVKVIGYKRSYNATYTYPFQYDYLLQVLGSEAPILVVKNSDDSGFIYIYSAVTTCDTTGYAAIDYCSTIPVLTTTTTTTAP